MVVAISEEIINQNPCSNMLLPLRNADIVERVAYNNADLQKIFRSPVYQTPPKRPIGGAGEAAHWLPLCGLYTGARLEELGQLAVSDIKLEDGIMYFDITDIPDDDESLRSEPEVDVNERLSEIDNSVKTPAGRRRVPMHTQLVRLGFVEYIEQQRSAGVQKLFPQLNSYKNRYTKNWSRWWGRYSDRHVTSDETKTFHSFRHTVIRRLRDLRVPEQVAKALVGHAARDTTSLYGRGFDLTTLNEEIQKLCYPALDLSHLYRN
jgi:integrase